MASILVLGGTAWFGRVLAERAMAAGHAVTCLARGSAGAPPDGARFVAADRSEPDAYREVAGETWDLVVEISWQPGFVRSALDALADRAGAWAVISSCSVYARNDDPGADESAALLDPVEGDTASLEQYGGAKVACERLSTERTGGRAVLLRAGLIGGDGDGSGRTGYWPGRCAMAGGGPVLAPDPAGNPVQIVDVRDLADFTLHAGLTGRSGPVNVVGERCTLDEALQLSSQVAMDAGYPAVDFVGRSDDWLASHGVQPWAGPKSLPLWLPGADHAGFAARSDRLALDWGLDRRPLVETLRGALDYEVRLGLDRDRRAGLTRAEELELLGA
jgi:nucleoside-diphosphate-sugar epimerase